MEAGSGAPLKTADAARNADGESTSVGRGHGQLDNGRQVTEEILQTERTAAGHDETIQAEQCPASQRKPPIGKMKPFYLAPSSRLLKWNAGRKPQTSLPADQKKVKDYESDS
jgi:hypothetical protein